MDYLRNCWYVAGFGSEIGRKPLGRRFLDERVVMYRKADGEIAAMDSRCAHRLASLEAGTVVGDDIQCRYHGLRFGPDGACTVLPSGGIAPPRARLRVYPVVERYSVVWIWMGDADMADPNAIPDMSSCEDPEFDWFDAYLHVGANYQLVVDNLLDLSHTEFLHPLLSAPGWQTRNQQTLTRERNSLIVRNEAKDDPILPLLEQLCPTMGKIGRTIQVEKWSAPGVIEFSHDYYSGDDVFRIPAGHFMTPETDKTCHYFVRGSQGLDPSNPALTEQMRAGVIHIFQTEDVTIIEAQQANLGDDELLDHDPAILQNDAASTRARRTMKMLIRQEKAEAVTSGTAAA